MQTTAFSRCRLPLAAALPVLALWAAPAKAVEEDAQLWFFFNSVVPLGDATSATIEISPRWREDDPDLLQTRATVEIQLSPSVEIGAGAAYIEYGGGYELRPHQQITFTSGRLSFRTRLEERFFAGAARAQFRLRQQVAASLPLGSGTKLTGSAELLYVLRAEERGQETRVDSWRGLIGLEQALSPTLSAEVAYHAILSPREGRPDRLSHIPRVTLTKRF